MYVGTSGWSALNTHRGDLRSSRVNAEVCSTRSMTWMASHVCSVNPKPAFRNNPVAAEKLSGKQSYRPACLVSRMYGVRHRVGSHVRNGTRK